MKKKTPLRQQLRKFLRDKNQRLSMVCVKDSYPCNATLEGGRHALLDFFFRTLVICILLICTLLSSACSSVRPYDPSKPVNYQNPPSAGSWLRAQRELVACQTEDAARYMADFGFFHAHCTQLDKIQSKEYQVLSRSSRQLKEGPMWLLQVKRNKELFYVPIPWHDWL